MAPETPKVRTDQFGMTCGLKTHVSLNICDIVLYDELISALPFHIVRVIIRILHYSTVVEIVDLVTREIYNSRVTSSTIM